MRRFLIVGTVFCTAAIFGIALSLFLAPGAAAVPCDENERQRLEECNSDRCTDPKLPHAAYDCGSTPIGHEPCNCWFVECFGDPCPSS